MTTKQIYSALAKIAGHRCYDGKKFMRSKRIGDEHREVIQRRLMVLLQKLDYGRAMNDFPDYYIEDQNMRVRAVSDNSAARLQSDWTTLTVPVFHNFDDSPESELTP